MKLYECSKCKKVLYENSVCPFCGNLEFGILREILVCDEVSDDFSTAEKCIETEDYENALKHLDNVVEWVPTSAAVFWMRLLASNCCSGIAELISSGISIEDDPNFYNGNRCAEDREKMVFSELEDVILGIRNTLKNKINDKELMLIRQLEIERLHQRSKELENSRKQAYGKYKEILLAELYMDDQILNYQIAISQLESELQFYKDKMNKLRNTIMSIKKCDEFMYAEHVKQMDAILKACQMCVDKLNELSDHDIVINFEEKKEEREKLYEGFLLEIESLGDYKEKSKAIMVEIDKIRRRRDDADGALREFDFVTVMDFVGEDKIYAALKENGLSFKPAVSEGRKNMKKNRKYVFYSYKIEDDEDKMKIKKPERDDDGFDVEDFYSSWGIF